jgi:FMN reductase
MASRYACVGVGDILHAVLQVLVILGSATPPGRFRRALDEAVERAAATGIEARLVDLADVRIGPAGAPPPDGGDDTATVVGSIGSARAVVFATPVYRGSLTGTLKNLLDHVPVEALEGKVVGVAAMGATLHHYLGVDRHLRDVLGWFGAVVVPVGAYLSSAHFVDGAPTDAAAAELDALLADTVRLSAGARGPLALRPLAARRPPA